MIARLWSIVGLQSELFNVENQRMREYGNPGPHAGTLKNARDFPNIIDYLSDMCKRKVSFTS